MLQGETEAAVQYSILAVSLGAAAGALVRWGLSLALNSVFTSLSLGTLAANLGGCFLAGCALGAFACWPECGERWSLLIFTGFLGALTTFSAFSVEVVTLVQSARLVWAGALIALHLCGSLVMTFLGLGVFALLRGAFH